jgi:hypothetical protein
MMVSVLPAMHCLMPFLCSGSNGETDGAKAGAQQWLSTQNQRGFLENCGQMTDMDGKPVPFVLMRTEAPGLIVWLTEKGLVIETLKSTEVETENDEYSATPEQKRTLDRKDERRIIQWERLDLELRYAIIKKNNIVKKYAQQESRNYFFGHCPNGINNVKEYETIIITSVYSGIDWRLYRKSDGSLKYDFIVHPGADYKQIEIVYKSRIPVKLNEQGQLELYTAYGNVMENLPVSFYQGKEITTHFIQQEPKKVRYKAEEGYETSVHFALDGVAGNLNSELIIDPQLTWATFYGGSNSWEGAMTVATDAAGNIFIAGYTNSTNFPVLSAGTFFQGSKAGNLDVAILKFTNAGALLWATMYGGIAEDWAYSIALDTNSNLFVTGHTGSSDFPLTTGTPAGNFDVFVLKFSNTGSRLWAACHGGANDDEAKSITCDNTGNIFVTGHTWSSNFPVLNAGTFFQGTYASGNIWGGDVFILKYSNSGTLLWSTYYGGSGADVGNSIECDVFGNVFISGFTTSSNFPVQSGGNYFQPVIGGGTDDAFILKFDNSGNRLWSTYYGGSGSDEAASVGCDGIGNAFVTGYTNSANFPLTPPVSPGQTTASWAGNVVNDASAGTVSWSTPSQATGSINDNLYGTTGSVSSGNISNYLKATNFGITMPPGMIITGVEVNVEWKGSGLAIVESSVRLVVGGVISGSNHSTGSSVGTIENVRTFGSNTDRWSLPLTASDVQNAGFGVAIAVSKSGGGGQTASVDRISIVIHYAASWSVMQSNLAGGTDAFIIKFNNAGTLLNATYFGGSGDEQFNSSDNIAVDHCGSYNVSFETRSTDMLSKDSCDVGYYDNTFNGGIADQFVAHFTNSGVLLWATYIGGNGWDFRSAISTDNASRIFIAGEWINPDNSTSYPATNPGAGAYYQPAFAGGTDDMSIARFQPATDCPCGIAPLPIELISFTAKVTNENNVLLQWSTGSEINNDYFTVERAKDTRLNAGGGQGIAFEEVLRKAGAGNSSVTQNYSALDSHPYSGISYYRLKQTDYDGSTSYSNIVSVSINDNELTVDILPNPSDGKFIIRIPAGKIETGDEIKIYNSLGEIVFMSALKERNTLIDMTARPHGIYFINISTGNETVIRKMCM